MPAGPHPAIVIIEAPGRSRVIGLGSPQLPRVITRASGSLFSASEDLSSRLRRLKYLLNTFASTQLDVGNSSRSVVPTLHVPPLPDQTWATESARRSLLVHRRSVSTPRATLVGPGRT